MKQKKKNAPFRPISSSNISEPIQKSFLVYYGYGHGIDEPVLVRAINEDQAILKYKTQYHCFTDRFFDYVYGIRKFDKFVNEHLYGYSRKPFGDSFWEVSTVEKRKNGEPYNAVRRMGEEVFVANTRAYFIEHHDFAEMFIDYELNIKGKEDVVDLFRFPEEMIVFIRLNEGFSDPNVYCVDDFPVID